MRYFNSQMGDNDDEVNDDDDDNNKNNNKATVRVREFQL
jgi:hypothetical protein